MSKVEKPTPEQQAETVKLICQKLNLSIAYMVIEYDGDLHIQTESKDRVEISVGDMSYKGPPLTETGRIKPNGTNIQEEPWKWPKRWGWSRK